MKIQVLNLLKVKKYGALVFTGLALATSTYFYKNWSSELHKLNKLNSGVGTCFKRVGQSFTANVISQNSAGYLQADFLSMTEECFGEALSLSEDVFAEGSLILKKMSELSTDVHWFHEKLLNNGSKFAGLTPTPVEDRFSDLELAYEKVDELISKRSERVESSTEMIKKAVGLLSFLLLGLSIVAFFDNRKRNALRLELESRATETLLNSENILEDDEVKDILEVALQSNDFKKCGQLFSRFHGDAINKIELYSDVEEIKSSKIIEKTPQKVVSSDLVQETKQVEAELNLDTLIGNIVEKASNLIFRHGIALEYDLDKDIYISEKSEAIQHIINQVVMHSVESCAHLAENKRIKIYGKKLGGSIILELEDSGLGHSQDFLDAEMGLKRNLSSSDLNLTVCKELVKDVGGQIAFENRYDDDNKVIGARTRIVLRGSSKLFTQGLPKNPTKRVKEIKKGSKKDILRSLGQIS